MHIPVWYLQIATIVFWLSMAAGGVLLVRGMRVKDPSNAEMSKAMQPYTPLWRWAFTPYAIVTMLLVGVSLFTSSLLVSAIWPIGIFILVWGFTKAWRS